MTMTTEAITKALKQYNKKWDDQRTRDLYREATREMSADSATALQDLAIYYLGDPDPEARLAIRFLPEPAKAWITWMMIGATIN